MLESVAAAPNCIPDYEATLKPITRTQTVLYNLVKPIFKAKPTHAASLLLLAKLTLLVVNGGVLGTVVLLLLPQVFSTRHHWWVSWVRCESDKRVTTQRKRAAKMPKMFVMTKLCLSQFLSCISPF